MEKVLARIALDDAYQQEQGILQIIHQAEAEKDPMPYMEALIGLFKGSSCPLPPNPAFVAGAVCQGLDAFVRTGKIQAHLVSNNLLSVIGELLSQQQQHHQDEEEGPGSCYPSPLSIFVSTLASICLYAVEQDYTGGQGSDAVYMLSEQPPLALAFSMNPPQMSSVILEEISLFNRTVMSSSAAIGLPALLGPIITTVLYEPQLMAYRSNLIQALALGPLDYLPQTCLLSLSLLYGEVLHFLPFQTHAELVFVNDWAKLVFHCICHLEDPNHVEMVGRPFVSRLLNQILILKQSSTGRTCLLHHIIILKRLADYLPSLLWRDPHILSYLSACSPSGPERSSLLSIIRGILEGCPDPPWASQLGQSSLRWSLYPIITLASLQDQDARSILSMIEARLVEGGRGGGGAPSSSSAAATTPAICPQSGLYLLLERSPAEVLQQIQSYISGLTSPSVLNADRNSSSGRHSWLLFLVMGVLFHPGGKKDIKASAFSSLRFLIEADSLIGPKVIPSLLYIMNSWKGQALLQNSLLAFLPNLGLHQTGAQMLVTLIRRLPSLVVVDGPDSAKLRVIMSSATMTLSAALYRTNTRTLPVLRQLILAESPLMEDVDEYRLAKLLAIRDVVKEDPEAGSEFVGILQTYLMDALPGIVALAVDCITYLCTADCLDYSPTLRILQKKGRIRNKEHPMVLVNLADLYGAGAFIFDCSANKAIIQGDDSSHSSATMAEYDEDSRPKLPEKLLWDIVDYLWLLAEQPYPQVRGHAYSSLAGYVSLLLVSEDVESVADLRQRLMEALLNETSSGARQGLGEVVKEVLLNETEDSGTWRAALGAKAGGGSGSGTTSIEGNNKPSRKTMKALPTATEIIKLYQKQRDAPGLAGASLHVLSAEPEAAGKGHLMELLSDVLIDENGGGRCYMQRFIAVQSFMRSMPFVIKDIVPDTDTLATTLEGVEKVEGLIRSGMNDPAARNVNNCFLALAGLAQALPPQLSHKIVEYAHSLQDVLMSASTSISVDIPTLQLSLALCGRCLGLSESDAAQALADTLLQSRNTFTSRTDLDWCLWGTYIGLATLTDWTRQQYSPDLTTFELLSRVTHTCLAVLQEILHSRALKGMLVDGGEVCGIFSAQGMQRSSAQDSGSVITWHDIDVSDNNGGTHGQDMGILGACWAIAIIAPNLAHAGMDRQLQQLYHIMMKAVESNVPGAEVGLAKVASLCLRSDLIGSGDVFEILKVFNGKLHATAPPSESVMLALSALTEGVKGVVTLPAGFLDAVKARLSSLAKSTEMMNEGATAQGRRIAAMLSLYSILAGGGPMVTLMGDSVGEGLGSERTTAATLTGLVEISRQGLTSSSQRFTSAAARILGLLAVLRYEDTTKDHPGGEVSIERRAGQVHSSSLSRIDVESFGLPSEGTLIRMIMMELINLAFGDMNGTAAGASSERGQAFIISTLEGLSSCKILRFQHKQVTLLLQNYFKAAQAQTIQQNLGFVTACVKFAVKTTPKDSSYATWLYDVAVNAPAIVIAMMLDYLGELVRLTPTNLVSHLISTIWSKLIKGGGGFRPPSQSTTIDFCLPYEQLVRLFTGLSQALDDNNKPNKSTAAAAIKGKEEPGAQHVANEIWSFLTKVVQPFLKESSFLGDLAVLFDQQQHPSSAGCCSSQYSINPLDLIEALADVLVSFRHPDVIQSFCPYDKGAGRHEVGNAAEVPLVLLSSILVIRRFSPVSPTLDSIRLCLLGPGSTVSSSASLNVLPFLAKAVIESGYCDKQGFSKVRGDWVKSLLDYIQVDPSNTRALAFLIHIMSGWWCSEATTPGVTTLTAADTIHEWRLARAAMSRIENQQLEMDDWVRIEAIVNGGEPSNNNTGFFYSLELEMEIEVVTRIMKILNNEVKARGPTEVYQQSSSLSLSSSSSKGLLCWFMIMLLGQAIREGRAVSEGSLPMAKVLVAQWSISRAICTKF